MAKYMGPSFVIGFLLQPHQYDHQKIENLFAISRVFYNQLLGETLKRYEHLQQDKRYQKNKRCIKGISKKDKSIRKQIRKREK